MGGFRVSLTVLMVLAGLACVRKMNRTTNTQLSREANADPMVTPAPSLEPTDTPTPAPTETPTAAPSPTAPRRVSFTDDIRPILAPCQPCHFPGGKVYDRLPFDRPETVRTLGTKLFTRIKDEEQQQVIRTFLAQNP